jgi:ParB family chromosome partitioning protein
MRLPWQKAEPIEQLDLLGDPAAPAASKTTARPRPGASPQDTTGIPRMVPTSQIDEDPANPRSEFPDDKVEELASDIRQRGILEALVVHPANEQGRYLLHFGAMRLRASVRAGLHQVPVIIRHLAADRYAQVAENLKRHSLTPLEMARFIRSEVEGGKSQTTIAARLGMNLTTVAHHLSLLELPQVLEGALKAGRCTSPRTLHELSKLHERQPEQVRDLVESSSDLTREAVSTLRARLDWSDVSRSAKLIAQATATCDRLDKLLRRITPSAHQTESVDLSALHAKVAALSNWSQRSLTVRPEALPPHDLREKSGGRDSKKGKAGV